MEKDAEVNHILSSQGWTVIRLWEHEIRNDLPDAADLVMRLIREKKAQLNE